MNLIIYFYLTLILFKIWSLYVLQIEIFSAFGISISSIIGCHLMVMPTSGESHSRGCEQSISLRQNLNCG